LKRHHRRGGLAYEYVFFIGIMFALFAFGASQYRNQVKRATDRYLLLEFRRISEKARRPAPP
jgi:hypothetical protein